MPDNPLRCYETTIVPRSADVGGGWRLSLLENGEEVGGGVFPAGHHGYIDAREEADAWLFSRPTPDACADARLVAARTHTDRSSRMALNMEIGSGGQPVGITSEPEEVTANARLVAAAPELLAALKALDDAAMCLGLSRDNGDDAWMEALRVQFTALRRARAIIAKAEGR